MSARRSQVRIAKKARSSKSSRTLPSATLPKTALAEVGARYATAALVKHANVVLAKMGKQAAFATYGFDGQWRSALEAQVATVLGAEADVRGARAAVLPTSKPLLDAIAAAKDWRRRASTVLALTPGAAHRYTATGSTPKRLIAALLDLVPRVADKATVAHGGGASLSNEGKALATQLAKASDGHVAAASEVSPELRALNVEKGILYEELGRLARAARLVAPKEAALYAPSAHLRARMKSRDKKKKAPATPAAPATAVA